jgi:hypothetical protein
VQDVLLEAEELLRASIPDESTHHRAASRLNLERALYQPKTSAGFPLRWSVVYAMAAALTITVFSGYLSTRQQAPETPQLAAVPQAPAVAAESPEALGLPQEAGLAPAAQASATSPPQPALSNALVAESLQPPPAPDAQFAADALPGEAEAQLARFELAASTDPQFEAKQVAWMDPPRVAALPGSVPVAALMPAPPVPTFRTVVEEFANHSATPRISDPVALSKVIEGYWLLTQAKVWQEDLQPVWTSRGLVIEGTVEDETVRQQVEAALLRHTSQPPAFRVGLREEMPAAQQRPNRRARLVQAVYSGPAGGSVRRSLLSHFSDAARQSFVSPQPAALDAEVARYVSELYRSQSELLSHAYALQRFLGRVDAAYLASADPQTARRFRDLVRFHLRALDEREASVYDRLSEALPRKVWSHRGAADESGEEPNWNEESQDLLQDTLELDSNLTALFGSSSLTLDATDPEQSCGELLHRIRTRIQRIKNRTQAL